MTREEILDGLSDRPGKQLGMLRMWAEQDADLYLFHGKTARCGHLRCRCACPALAPFYCACECGEGGR